MNVNRIFFYIVIYDLATEIECASYTMQQYWVTKSFIIKDNLLKAYFSLNFYSKSLLAKRIF